MWNSRLCHVNALFKKSNGAGRTGTNVCPSIPEITFDGDMDVGVRADVIQTAVIN